MVSSVQRLLLLLHIMHRTLVEYNVPGTLKMLANAAE